MVLEPAADALDRYANHPFTMLCIVALRESSGNRVWWAALCAGERRFTAGASSSAHAAGRHGARRRTTASRNLSPAVPGTRPCDHRGTGARSCHPERPRLPAAAGAVEDPAGAFPGRARLAGEVGPEAGRGHRRRGACPGLSPTRGGSLEFRPGGLPRRTKRASRRSAPEYRPVGVRGERGLGEPAGCPSSPRQTFDPRIAGFGDPDLKAVEFGLKLTVRRQPDEEGVDGRAPTGYRRIPRRDGVPAHVEVSEPEAQVARQSGSPSAPPSAPLERHGKTVTRAKGDPALRFNPVSRRHT